MIRLILLCWALSAAGQEEVVNDPPPTPLVLIKDTLQVTALTPELLRIEYKSDPKKPWNTLATSAVVNRQLTDGKDVNAKLVRYPSDVVEVETDAVRFGYNCSKPKWPEGFLRLLRKDGNGEWMPDKPYDGNLKGTIRTLDGQEAPTLDCEKFSDPTDQYHCSYGVLSTSGIALLDDSEMPAYEGEQPVANPAGEGSKDMYFFAYGKDYKKALKNFQELSGPQPLIPRYAYGVWFTRWFGFDDTQYRAQVDWFEQNNLPLDVFIWDMNWHTFGDWGGYTWNFNLIPAPALLVQAMKRRGLHLGANFHDADGVKPSNLAYADFVRALNDPTLRKGETVPFTPANTTRLEVLEDTVVAPLGVDIDWTDYQQGEHNYNVSDEIPNLNPTIQLNRVRHQTHKRKNDRYKRGLILSRFGGVGNHRYPVGFGGDQAHSWEGLNYLPTFTSTAANIGFGLWSHDIYGGRQGELANDWDLATRWIQFGAMSPVLRMHDKGEGVGGCADKGDCSKIEMWDHPHEHLQAEKKVLKMRSEFLPYIYTQQHQATQTGVAMVRPLYVDFPNTKGAYLELSYGCGKDYGYMWGDDMVVFPVTIPQEKDTLLTKDRKVFVPPGKWWDVTDGRMEDGGQSGITVARQCLINEFPLLQKVASAVPLYDRQQPIGGAHITHFANLRWQVVLDRNAAPGQSFKGQVFDDDGVTPLKNTQFQILELEVKMKSANEFDLVYTNKGPNFSSTVCRHVKVQLMNFIGNVHFSGPNAKSASASYDYKTGSVIMEMSSDSICNTELGLGVILEDFDQTPTAARDMQGFIGATRKAARAKLEMDKANVNYGNASRGNLTDAVTAPVRIEYELDSPNAGESFFSLWRNMLTSSQSEVAALKSSMSAERYLRVSALLKSALALTSSNDAAAVFEDVLWSI